MYCLNCGSDKHFAASCPPATRERAKQKVLADMETFVAGEVGKPPRANIPSPEVIQEATEVVSKVADAMFPAPQLAQIDAMMQSLVGKRVVTAKRGKPAMKQLEEYLLTGKIDGKMAPVTIDVTPGVTQPITQVTPFVTAKHCPTCTCQRVYKSLAEKQKAYRARKGKA